jgi:dienelactone hydrolase
MTAMARCWRSLWAGAALVALAASAQERPVAPAGPPPFAAYWFKAPGDRGEKRPLMLALHGCGGALDAQGGLNSSWRRYAAYFTAERMHFVVIDSFSPRGVKSICEQTRRDRPVTEEDRRQDVFAALAWLARQPQVDAARLMVAGWSHGAQTVLAAADASNADVLAEAVQPVALAAFYPGCARALENPQYALHRPVLLMAGALDDWTPAHICERLHERLAAQRERGVPGARMELEVYPGSYHGFDSVGEPRVRGNVAGTRSGRATVGGNTAARAASHARLFEFAASQFGQPLQMSHAHRLALPALPEPAPQRLMAGGLP